MKLKDFVKTFIGFTKILKIFYIPFFIFLTVRSECNGCGLEPWGVDEALLRKQGFSVQKIKELASIHSDLQQEKATLRAELEEKENALEKLLDEATVDKSKILIMQETISKLRNKILEADLKAMFKVRRILTAEEYKKFRQLIKKGVEPCEER